MATAGSFFVVGCALLIICTQKISKCAPSKPIRNIFGGCAVVCALAKVRTPVGPRLGSPNPGSEVKFWDGFLLGGCMFI